PGDRFAILDNQTGNPLGGTLNGIVQDGTVNVVFLDNSPAGTFHVSYTGDVSGPTINLTNGNDLVLYGFTPVPEPGSVLAVCAAAAGRGCLIRRGRRSRASSGV